jgi:integrase
MSHEFRADPPITFAEAASLYRGERRFLAQWVEYFRNTTLAELTQEVIDRAITDRLGNVAPSTQVRQGVTPISAVLQHAAARGLCEPRQIRRPKQPKSDRLRWLWPTEASRLIDACSDHLKPIVVLCLMTTCHPSEAIFLDWNQVDLVRRRVEFPQGRKRNARTVSLHPINVAALARLPQQRGAVFRCPDGRSYRRERGAAAVKTAFAAACRRASIKDFTIRDVRVTSAVWQLARNRDFDALMRRGGWRGDPRMAARYKRISTAELDALRAALREQGWDSAPPIAGSVRR